MKHLAYLNRYFIRYKWRMLLGMVFVVCSKLFEALPARIVRHAFDLVGDNITYYKQLSGFSLQSKFYSQFAQAILFFGLIIFVIALIKGAFMFLMRQTIIVTSRIIENDLRNDIYAHYQQLSTAFYKKNRTGDMMARSTQDVSNVRQYLGPAIMYALDVIALMLVLVTSMWSVSPELTLYVLLPLPFLSGGIYYINRIINRRSEAIQRQMSVLTNIAQESFSGIRVIKAYNQEQPTNNEFANQSDQYKQRTLRLARVQAFFFPLMLFLIGFSSLLTIYIGGNMVIAGKITAGNVAEFVIYVNMLTWPITSVGWVASMVQQAAASQKRINEFLQTKPEITSPNNNNINLKGKLTFDNISFTYPETGITALKQVSFSLQPGQKMAIVGRTGCGKSTIAELLVRKYDVSSGEISFDDLPIAQLNLTQLRQQIGYAPQEVFLFSDTVSNNIAFGMENASEENIRNAAQNAAVLNDILQLPNGMQTIVGERGVTLSGGQKQRIALARALIKNPEIIVLDDCLSAVDANTEEQILTYLNTYLKPKTAIVITHRIFSLMNFDQILVLHDGQIIEQGTHQTLLDKKGHYFNIYQKQQEDKKKT